MAILAISHVIISVTYKHQNDRLRVFRQAHTDFALSKVLKRLLSYAILLHELLRLSFVFLITLGETKTAASGKKG
jgi:hypothetical protein